MKNLKWLSLALVAVFAAACDPYDDEKTGTPSIVTVIASNPYELLDPVLGTASGEAWTVADVPCGTIAAGELDNSVFFIVLDRQVDGALVQAALTDCTPAPASLTITPAAAAGNAWYTCYSPASATPDSGGSIVVFQGAEGGLDGWTDSAHEPLWLYLPAATYEINGTIAGRLIDVTITPDAATCGGV